jgi:hypothetical protein
MTRVPPSADVQVMAAIQQMQAEGTAVMLVAIRPATC